MPNLQLYLPHANQQKIHRSRARNRVVVAGRRFGKSALGLNEGIARAFQKQRQIIWIILPLLKQAKEIYWIDPDVTRYFMPYVQQGLVKKNDSELSLYFYPTESWIRLKGSDNYDSLRGSGLDLIVWDEDADCKPEAKEAIKPALADSFDYEQLFIGTPKGLNHFHDLALLGDHQGIIPSFDKPITPDPDYETFHFTSYDNLTWAEGSDERKAFVAYIDKEKKELEEKGKLAWFNQEYAASFEEGAGRFFPKWSSKTHKWMERFDPGSYPLFGDMDWGRTAPFSFHVSAVVPVTFEGQNFNRVITFKEVYGTDKSPAQQIDEIVGKEPGQLNFDTRRVQWIACDPAMFNTQQDGAASIVDQMKEHFDRLGLQRPVFKPGSRNRVGRWAMMENWMTLAPDGKPYWMITGDCPNLLRTLPLMMADEHNPEDLDTDLEDHAVDDISYGLGFVKFIDGKVGGVKYRQPVAVKRVENPVKAPSLDAFAAAGRTAPRRRNAA